nr:ATP-binding cassette domain-containing protein [Acetatifactor sp.]
MEKKVLELRNICKSFRDGKESRQILKNVSLEVAQGEFVAIMGPSGCGKSTLLHLMGLLHKPDSGSLSILDTDVLSLSREE